VHHLDAPKVQDLPGGPHKHHTARPAISAQCKAKQSKAARTLYGQGAAWGMRSAVQTVVPPPTTSHPILK
jgi:hypothetical protein